MNINKRKILEMKTIPLRKICIYDMIYVCMKYKKRKIIEFSSDEDIINQNLIKIDSAKENKRKYTRISKIKRNAREEYYTKKKNNLFQQKNLLNLKIVTVRRNV